MPAERRQYERFMLTGSVKLKNEGESALLLEGRLRDIGFNGLSLEGKGAAGEIAVGRVVDFELLPGLPVEALAGKCKVRYVNKAERNQVVSLRMGVEFVQVNKDFMAFLIKRIQLKIAQEIQRKSQSKPVDFIPY